MHLSSPDICYELSPLQLTPYTMATDINKRKHFKRSEFEITVKSRVLYPLAVVCPMNYDTEYADARFVTEPVAGASDCCVLLRI